MFKHNMFLFITLCCFLYGYVNGMPTISQDIAKQHKNNSIDVNSKKWDYLMFTQTWPTTSCLIWQMESPKHKCNITCQIDSWTVHGIWPSSLESSDPSFCNKSDPFDVKQIQSIKQDLDKYWANVYAHTAEDSLWSHEWEKHGTCATTLPQLNTELRFFQQGLKWIQQFNMLSILKNSGIEPSSGTPVLTYDVETAIQNTLHVNPLLICNYIKANKTYYIYEIELCFDKDLNLMNCPADAIDKTPLIASAERCPRNTLIWYLPITYPTIKRKQFETIKVGFPNPRLIKYWKTIEDTANCIN